MLMVIVPRMEMILQGQIDPTRCYEGLKKLIALLRIDIIYENLIKIACIDFVGDDTVTSSQSIQLYKEHSRVQ